MYGLAYTPCAANVAYAEARSMTCGLATPSVTEGPETISTDVGIPALRATSMTLSGPTLIPSGTKTVFTELAIASKRLMFLNCSFP